MSILCNFLHIHRHIVIIPHVLELVKLGFSFKAIMSLNVDCYNITGSFSDTDRIVNAWFDQDILTPV